MTWDAGKSAEARRSPDIGKGLASSPSNMGADVRRVLVCVLMALVASLLVASPAQAAFRIRLGISPSTPVVSAVTTLGASVRPRRSGRRVLFAERVGGRWVSLGSARTNTRGKARRAVVFRTPGTVTVRAIAVAFRGQRQAMVKRTVVVLPAPVTVGGTSGSGGTGGSGGGGDGGGGTGGGDSGGGGSGSGAQPTSFAFDGLYLATAGETHTKHDDLTYSRDCTTQVPATPVASFDDTLTAIDAFTASGTATQAWHDLALSDPTRPDREDDVASIAMGAHSPAAALAAFVQGYRDHPSQVYFLNGAAAAANAVGHPEWAVALENQAATLNTSGSTGIPDEAIRLTNLGHADAMMGDWATAKGLVEQAHSLAPNAPQINQELAAVTKCAGDAAGARTAYNNSLRTGKPGDDDAVDTDYGTSRTSAAKIWDLSHATSPTIDLPALPSTPADLAAQADNLTTGAKGFWHTELDRLDAQDLDLGAQIDSLGSQLDAEQMSPLERQQIQDIIGNLTYDVDAQLIQLEHTMEPAQWAIDDCPVGNNAHFCGGQYTNTDCGMNEQAFDLWHSDIAAWREDFFAYEGRAEQVFSGMRANLEDPVAYDLAGAWIKSLFNSEAVLMVQDVYYKSVFLPTHDGDTQCWTVAGQDPAPTPTKLDNIDPGVCDAAQTKSHVSFSLEGEAGEGVGWSVKSSCTSVDVEANTTVLPFLSGFTSASFSKDGSGLTMLGGVKASGGGASFESALYLTYDKDGHVTDFGWEVGPGFEPSYKGVSLDVGSDLIRISFMSVFTQPVTPS